MLLTYFCVQVHFNYYSFIIYFIGWLFQTLLFQDVPGSSGFLFYHIKVRISLFSSKKFLLTFLLRSCVKDQLMEDCYLKDAESSLQVDSMLFCFVSFIILKFLLMCTFLVKLIPRHFIFCYNLKLSL